MLLSISVHDSDILTIEFTFWLPLLHFGISLWNCDYAFFYSGYAYCNCLFLQVYFHKFTFRSVDMVSGFSGWGGI